MKKNAFLISTVVLLLLTACSGDEKTTGKKYNEYDINVYVIDGDQKPVEGVKVQACNEALCIVTDTDSDGHAGFDMDGKAVEVHILKAPAAYSFDSEAEYQTDDNGEVTVTLEPSGN